MRKLVLLGLVLALSLSCAQNQAEVERTVEDGVEVVINHLEPYKIEGVPGELHLEEVLNMDIEREEISALGLADIQTFDVDSEGNIFIFQFPKKDGHLVFKFSKAGDFLMSFGVIGQGPGEIQTDTPWYMRITSRDEIPIVDRTAKKILFFSSQGDFLRDTPFDMYFLPRGGFLQLENGNYLIHRIPLGPRGEIQSVIISMFDSDLHKIKDLIEYEIPGTRAEKINVFLEMPVVGISRSQIFVGYEKVSNDISVYDLNGELKRKIRKEYKPVPVPGALKQELRERWGGRRPSWDRLYVPTHMPLFQYMFTDDEGRLYVVTSEMDRELGTNICEIYTADGIFIGRKSMGYYDLAGFILLFQQLDIVAKGGRFYCMREKESGYKELMVYKMKWE